MPASIIIGVRFIVRPNRIRVAVIGVGLALGAGAPMMRAQSSPPISAELNALPLAWPSLDISQPRITSDGDQHAFGRISGKVVDPAGVPVTGARVTLEAEPGSD